MIMSIEKKTTTSPTGRYASTARVEGPAPPAKRLRATPKTRSVTRAVVQKVESLEGVVHEWVRQYQPNLFEQIQLKEARLKDLAIQVEITIEPKIQEALRMRLDREKRELVALVWDAMALFEGKPLSEPSEQGHQLGLLVQIVNPEGQIFYIPRARVENYLKEGYRLAESAPPVEE